MKTQIARLCLLGAFLVGTLHAQVEVKLFANSSQLAAHPIVVVEVPPDWSIIGGGATTSWNGTDAGNLLVSAYPLDKHHWIASSKDHSVSSPAVLTAYAVAIKNPQQGLYDVKIFAQQSSGQTDNPSASVLVDSSYQMTGGGAKAETGGPGLLLTASYPSSDRGWTTIAKAHSVSSPGSVTAYAIGVKSKTSKPFPPVTRFPSATSGGSLSPESTINVSSGFILTGGGAEVQYSDTVGCLLTETSPKGNFGWSGKAKAHSVPSTCTMTVFSLGLNSSNGADAKVVF